MVLCGQFNDQTAVHLGNDVRQNDQPTVRSLCKFVERSLYFGGVVGRNCDQEDTERA